LNRSDMMKMALAAIVIMMYAIMVGIARGEEYNARFMQQEPPAVDGWEFQELIKEWVTIDTSASVVTPWPGCEQCWQVPLDLRKRGLIRARAMGVDGQFSDWSNTIAVSEQGIEAGLAIGFALLHLLSSRFRANSNVVT
jgi:hypothetical protein